MKSPNAKAVHSIGDRDIQPGSLVHGDGGTTFVATARWIAHQQGSSCQHPQVEPVILSTGELVACVCIGCYQQLPADYIEGQAERAHREAYWPDSEREAARRRWLALHSPNELRMDAGYPEL